MNVKKVFLSALIVLSSSWTSAQTEQGSEKSREGAVFGLLLGHDTFAEVIAKTKYTTSSYCDSYKKSLCVGTYEIERGDELEYKGKMYVVDNGPDGSGQSSGLTFISFNIGDEDFAGTFFENKLIALKLLKKKSPFNYYLEADESAKLKKSLDKKYKKNPTRRGKGPLKDGHWWTYTFQTWLDPNSNAEIQIVGKKLMYTTVAACIESNRDLYLKYRDIIQKSCESKSEPLREYLEYRAVPQYAQAMEKVLEKKAEADRAIAIEKNKEIEKAEQRINRF